MSGKMLMESSFRLPQPLQLGQVTQASSALIEGLELSAFRLPCTWSIAPVSS